MSRTLEKGIPPMRRFVIGDIHGCSDALAAVLREIAPQPDDELVFLGDYVDRGPDSRGVVDQLLDWGTRCRLIPLRGNHEIMLMGVAIGDLDPAGWFCAGGLATLESYGGSLEKIPGAHLDFFARLLRYYETESDLFVHAGYVPDVPLAKLDEASCYWNHLTDQPPPPHCSGKRAFVGHTPQADGKVADHGHLVCMDTYCFGGGYLSAMEIASGRVIQADRRGRIRRGLAEQALAKLLGWRNRWRDSVRGGVPQRPAADPETGSR